MWDTLKMAYFIVCLGQFEATIYFYEEKNIYFLQNIDSDFEEG